MEKSAISAGIWLRRLVLSFGLTLGVPAFTSCVHLGEPAEVVALKREVSEQLVALPGAGEAARREARRIADVAVRTAREQSDQYDVLVPGWFHNIMVNTGVRERGLCWHWMEDIYPRLRALEPKAFRIVCGVRDSGTRREHHCVVAVPAGRPFEDGLVLDPWEKGGRLKAFPVRAAKRPWRYDPAWTDPLEQRFLAARASAHRSNSRPL